jgi:hypothetical protein
MVKEIHRYDPTTTLVCVCGAKKVLKLKDVDDKNLPSCEGCGATMTMKSVFGVTFIES